MTCSPAWIGRELGCILTGLKAQSAATEVISDDSSPARSTHSDHVVWCAQVNRPQGGAQQSRRLAFSTAVPNVARIYDVLLGGKDNYPADRVAAGELVNAVPGAVAAARGNRAFLQRAVRFLAGEAGISQFLDIGSGLPTVGNVHEVAQGACPAAHVVYVDFDPVAVLRANVMLANSLTAVAVN